MSSTTSFTILIGFLFFIARIRAIGTINEKIRIAEKEKNRIHNNALFGKASKEDEEKATERLDQLKVDLKNARTLFSFNNITLTIPAPDNGPNSQGMLGSSAGSGSVSTSSTNGSDRVRKQIESKMPIQLESDLTANDDDDWRVIPTEATAGTQLFRILFGVTIITALVSILALIAVDPISFTTATNIPLS